MPENNLNQLDEFSSPWSPLQKVISSSKNGGFFTEENQQLEFPSMELGKVTDDLCFFFFSNVQNSLFLLTCHEIDWFKEIIFIHIYIYWIIVIPV